MPLHIVSTVNPETIPGVDASEEPAVALGVPPPTTGVPPPPGGGTGSPGQAAPFQPAPLKGLEIQVEMPPVINAGVRLARLVLYIAAGSIVLLITYLISMDLVIGSDVHKSYDHILNPSRIGSEFYTLGRLEQLSLDLSTAKKDPAVTFTADSLQNAESILAMVDALPSVTATEKDQLKSCIPLPKDNSRNEKLDRCNATLANIRQAALEAAAGATNAQVASDSVTKTNENRQNLHIFWIQAAQLILLNLLLPLLTALFGYIFGTQQAQKTS